MRSAAEAAPSFLYLPALAEAGDRLTLDGDEARYLTKVVRARDGEQVTATDGAGLQATLVIESTRPQVQLAVTARQQVAPPAQSRLLCGAPEGERGDWLVEKLAELGVSAFQPVECERGRWPEHARQARWERLAVSALRQSQSAWLMELASPVSLEQALASGLPEVRWLADPGGATGSALAWAADGAVAGAVGPSSGFSDSERKLLSSLGFVAVRLAHARLRSETAAVALAAHWAARR